MNSLSQQCEQALLSDFSNNFSSNLVVNLERIVITLKFIGAEVECVLLCCVGDKEVMYHYKQWALWHPDHQSFDPGDQVSKHGKVPLIQSPRDQTLAPKLTSFSFGPILSKLIWSKQQILFSKILGLETNLKRNRQNIVGIAYV